MFQFFFVLHIFLIGGNITDINKTFLRFESREKFIVFDNFDHLMLNEKKRKKLKLIFNQADIFFQFLLSRAAHVMGYVCGIDALSRVG